MKVAVVSPYPLPGVAPVGGVEVAAGRLAHALHGQGVTTTVIAVHGTGDDTSAPVPVLRLDVDDRWSVLRDLRPLRAALAEALAAVRPDVVHAEDLMPAGYAATSVATPGVPTVITAHGNRRQDTMSVYRGLSAHARWLLARPMTLRAVSEADAVVGVNPDWRISLPISPSRFVYIPNIVAEPFYSAERRPEGRRVLYCGGPRRIKGWDILLAAWPLVLRRVPDARLHAPGCAGALGEVPAEIAASIDAEGWLRSDRLAAAMARAAVVVLPSRYDVAPQAMCEAWAVGVPVVAAAVGGIPGLAEGAARLVYEASPIALSEQIVGALTDEEANIGIVEEAHRRAQLQRAEQVGAAHVELYESLLAR